MSDITTSLRQGTVAFRTQLEVLCLEGGIACRPDSIGYLIAQARERCGRAEELDTWAFMELQQIAEMAHVFALCYPKDPRVDAFADLLEQCMLQAGTVYDKPRKSHIPDASQARIISGHAKEILALLPCIRERKETETEAEE